MSSFPSDEEFKQCIAASKIGEDAIDWRKLPTNVVYRVQPLVSIEMKNGSNTLLHLVNRENNEIVVWAPRTVVNHLKAGIKVKRNDAYIMSLGQKERKVGDRKRKYFDYETVFLRQQQEPQKQQPRQKRTKLETETREKVSLKDLCGEDIETPQKQQRPQKQQKQQPRQKRTKLETETREKVSLKDLCGEFIETLQKQQRPQKQQKQQQQEQQQQQQKQEEQQQEQEEKSDLSMEQ